jgi:hypothetical protein
VNTKNLKKTKDQKAAGSKEQSKPTKAEPASRRNMGLGSYLKGMKPRAS